MEHGNVLVIGNSGVGKSTLINAVLGESRAKTGRGSSGTTKKLSIYESKQIPFRIIDTIGFEPTFIKEQQAINAVKKWSKDCAKNGHENNQINVIWFCVDGTSGKLFDKTIKDLSHATSFWKSVPVVVVITKSYSVPERKDNIEMVYNAFAKQRKHSVNVRKVIPVVASTYTINDTAYAPPEGITELIDITNELLPEGIKAAQSDLADFKLSRKRALAQGTIAVCTVAGVGIGLTPIPFADAALLQPLEIGEINALARLYEINKGKESNDLINHIIEVGTVSAAAKALISAVKSIPGINIAAGILNAIIAGSIVFALGEGSVYVFEQIYLGNKTVADIDWVTKIMENKLSGQLVDIIADIIKKTPEQATKHEIGKIITDTFHSSKKRNK